MKLFRRKVKANRGPATNEVPSNETPAVASKDIERVEADAVQVTPSGSARPVDVFDLLDQMFAEWSGLAPPHRSGPSGAGWPATALIRVDQMMQNSELVVRAELPGIDPEKDIELTVSDGHLHIEGERRRGPDREGGLPTPGAPLRGVQAFVAAARRRGGVRHRRHLPRRHPRGPDPDGRIDPGQEDPHRQGQLTRANTSAAPDPSLNGPTTERPPTDGSRTNGPTSCPPRRADMKRE